MSPPTVPRDPHFGAAVSVQIHCRPLYRTARDLVSAGDAERPIGKLVPSGRGRHILTTGSIQIRRDPGVSNDNPYSEGHFKIVKYHPGFPGRFGCIDDAKDFCRKFFQWYNTEHRHGGIGLRTPQQVHLVRAPEVIEHRQNVLASAYAARPDRFVGGPPRASQLPAEVWINRPLPVAADESCLLRPEPSRRVTDRH